MRVVTFKWNCVIRKMERSSVFVLLLLVLGTSCREKEDWTIAELTGAFTLGAKPTSFFDRCFSDNNVSGWNYDDPYIPNLILCADSSFEIQGNGRGGGFEFLSYNGRWWIAHDTITLLPWYSYYGKFNEEDAENLDGTWAEVYVIQTSNAFEVHDSRLFDKGRVLIRR